MEKELYEQMINLAHLKVDSVEMSDKTINVYCHLDIEEEQCSSCLQMTREFKSYRTHTVRDLDISGREVYLHIRVKQFYCRSCKSYFTQKIPFADSNKSYTHRQSKWVFELCRKQPISEVGALVNMHAKTVERIFFDCALPQSDDRYKRYEGVTRLGIDELSWRKGKKDYICCLTNLDTGETIDILRTRDKKALIAHFESIKLKSGLDFCTQIEVISCDFWGPFLDIAKLLFPQADVVGDRFHWTIYINKVLDDQRKELRRAFPKEELYKNIKWLLFRPMHTLTPIEKENLDKTFKLEPILEELYMLKNTFCNIFDMEISKEEALTQIDEWVEYAQTVSNQFLDTFLAFFKRQQTTITNHFKHKVSNAATEGNNNILRTVKRFTFNMTNFEHFRARCFAFKN
jgi:transposase